MVRDLQQLKDEKDILRSELIVKYKESEYSMLMLAKNIGIPYTSFRAFMMGGNIGYKNMFKIKEWLSAA